MVATYRVPASDSREALRATARVAALRNVVERRRALGVQERVKEAERSLAVVQARVVEERDNRGERGRRRRRAVDSLELARDVDRELHALGRDVGERAALGVEQALVRVSERLEVARDGVLLVVRLREDVREPARGEGGRSLRVDALGAAHGGQAAA